MKVSLRLTNDWHATLRALIDATAPETITSFHVRTALDAGDLCVALLKVHRGDNELIPALHAYEVEMIDRGFRVVEASLK